MKNADGKETKNKFEWIKQYSLGFYVLIAAGVWAVVEFVMAILYFF